MDTWLAQIVEEGFEKLARDDEGYDLLNKAELDALIQAPELQKEAIFGLSKKERAISRGMKSYNQYADYANSVLEKSGPMSPADYDEKVIKPWNQKHNQNMPSISKGGASPTYFFQQELSKLGHLQKEAIDPLRGARAIEMGLKNVGLGTVGGATSGAMGGAIGAEKGERLRGAARGAAIGAPIGAAVGLGRTGLGYRTGQYKSMLEMLQGTPGAQLGEARDLVRTVRQAAKEMKGAKAARKAWKDPEAAARVRKAETIMDDLGARIEAAQNARWDALGSIPKARQAPMLAQDILPLAGGVAALEAGRRVAKSKKKEAALNLLKAADSTGRSLANLHTEEIIKKAEAPAPEPKGLIVGGCDLGAEMEKKAAQKLTELVRGLTGKSTNPRFIERTVEALAGKEVPMKVVEKELIRLKPGGATRVSKGRAEDMSKLEPGGKMWTETAVRLPKPGPKPKSGRFAEMAKERSEAKTRGARAAVLRKYHQKTGSAKKCGCGAMIKAGALTCEACAKTKSAEKRELKLSNLSPEKKKELGKKIGIGAGGILAATALATTGLALHQRKALAKGLGKMRKQLKDTADIDKGWAAAKKELDDIEAARAARRKGGAFGMPPEGYKA